MPTYIVLCTFERAEIERLVDSDLKLDQNIKKLIEAAGGQLKEQWLTTGAYDMVLVVEAEDTGTALSFVVAFSSLGRVSTQTLTAEADIKQVLDQARGAKTNVGGGGEG